MTEIVFRSLVDSLVALCDRTGLSWGPNSRELFWYRSPEVHVVEFFVFHLFVFLVYRASSTYFRKAMTHGKRTAMPASLLNRFVGVVYLLCWLFQVFLKAVRPRPLVQLCWLFMPCHLITLIWVYIFLMSTPNKKNYRLCVYLASLAAAFHWGPTSAAMFPDWSDHQFKIEGTIFAIHHGLLLITPVYFAARYELLPFTSQFLLHATWVATLINVGPYTIISYLSGLNVNYHLYPPPKVSKLAVFASQYYRYYVIAILVVMTVAFYLSIVGCARVVRLTFSRSSKKSVSD